MEIFVLMSAFAIKHFVGDFVLQSQYMIDQKGTYGAWGGICHSLIHATLTAGIVTFAGVPLADIFGLACCDYAFHYHIDWLKQNISARFTTQDPEFWMCLGADQMLHTLTYLFLTLYIVIL